MSIGNNGGNDASKHPGDGFVFDGEKDCSDSIITKLDHPSSSSPVNAEIQDRGIAPKTAFNSGTLFEATGGRSDSAVELMPHAPVQTAGEELHCSSAQGSFNSDTCSSTDSSDESVVIRKVNSEVEKVDKIVPKTKGEILYQDLPPMERCDAEFPANGRLLPIATVSHCTERLLILSSLPNTPPVDEGTIFWTKDGTSIAQVFETFGPVRKPFYSVRIISVDDLPLLGVALKDTVYVIPAHPSYTKYVFPHELIKWKGSDASWKDDNEVPPQFQDYSDDENEQRASRRKGGIKRERMKHHCDSNQAARQPSITVRQPSITYGTTGAVRQPSIMYSTTRAVRQPSVMCSTTGAVRQPSITYGTTGAVRQPSITYSTTGAVRQPSITYSTTGAVRQPSITYGTTGANMQCYFPMPMDLYRPMGSAAVHNNHPFLPGYPGDIPFQDPTQMNVCHLPTMNTQPFGGITPVQYRHPHPPPPRTNFCPYRPDFQ